MYCNDLEGEKQHTKLHTQTVQKCFIRLGPAFTGLYAQTGYGHKPTAK